MKKALLLGFLLAGCIQADARILVVECRNTKGPSGYYEVLESHKSGIDALSCKNPGDKDCRFRQPITQTPPAAVPVDQVSSAMDQIETTIDIAVSNGNSSGTFSSEIGAVQWSQTEEGIRTIEID